jgi:hypothetical protein
MRDPFPVFVGSTFTDLERHREAVLLAFQRLEMVARGMEHFGSLPGMPQDECLIIVRSCRAYVGIFAMRYGSIDAETGKSVTELEYEEAQRFHIPSLIYLIDEERQPVLTKDVDFGEAGEKLRSLKIKLKQRHVVTFFTTPDDLAMRVTQDIACVIRERNIDVSDGPLAQIVANLPRADWPNDEEFRALKARIGSLADPIGSDIILREVLQFIFVGDNFAATFLITKSCSLNVRQAITLLMSISGLIEKVALEGYQLMEKEGRVPPEFVRAFEERVSENSKSRMP